MAGKPVEFSAESFYGTGLYSAMGKRLKFLSGITHRFGYFVVTDFHQSWNEQSRESIRVRVIRVEAEFCFFFV